VIIIIPCLQSQLDQFFFLLLVRVYQLLLLVPIINQVLSEQGLLVSYRLDFSLESSCGITFSSEICANFFKVLRLLLQYSVRFIKVNFEPVSEVLLILKIGSGFIQLNNLRIKVVLSCTELLFKQIVGILNSLLGLLDISQVLVHHLNLLLELRLLGDLEVDFSFHLLDLSLAHLDFVVELIEVRLQLNNLFIHLLLLYQELLMARLLLGQVLLLGLLQGPLHFGSLLMEKGPLLLHFLCHFLAFLLVVAYLNPLRLTCIKEGFNMLRNDMMSMGAISNIKELP